MSSKKYLPGPESYREFSWNGPQGRQPFNVRPAAFRKGCTSWIYPRLSRANSAGWTHEPQTSILRSSCFENRTATKVKIKPSFQPVKFATWLHFTSKTKLFCCVNSTIPTRKKKIMPGMNYSFTFSPYGEQTVKFNEDCVRLRNCVSHVPIFSLNINFSPWTR